jgi:transcription antitermination protein NusB
MVMSVRRLARVLALQSLFEVDVTGHPAGDVLARRLAEQGLTGEGAEFARRLTQGVMDHQAELDGIIAGAAPNWPMDQMAKVDKNVLRLALQELLFESDVPLKAAINEAVELGKRFGTVAARLPPRPHPGRRPHAPAPPVEALVDPGPELGDLHGWLDELDETADDPTAG